MGESPKKRRRFTWPGGFQRSLAAILFGNLLYFSIVRTLPLEQQEKAFTPSWLFLDFLLCAALYGLSRLVFRDRP